MRAVLLFVSTNFVFAFYQISKLNPEDIIPILLPWSANIFSGILIIEL